MPEFLASTLTGNCTLVGSVANLVIVQRTLDARIKIGFQLCSKVGAPLTSARQLVMVTI